MNSEYQTPPPIQTLLNGHMCGSRGAIEGPHPLLENQKFYGFLEFAFGPRNRLDTPPPPPPPETL